MKKKILIADKDASLKDAFRVIFSDDAYEILYAATAKEVEQSAEEAHPEIYIVNVVLQKSSGIEVYKKLQKEKRLGNARFFFMKDENDTTELLGYQADGVIEKPINFFKVHERIATGEGEERIIQLTEVVEEPVTAVAETKGDAVKEDSIFKDMLEERASGLLGGRPSEGMQESAYALETELKKVMREALEAAAARLPVTRVVEEMAGQLAEKMAPIISGYVEDYTRRVLYEMTERIIREEIDKLLKESTA